MRTAVVLVIIFSLIGGFLFWRYSGSLFNREEEKDKQITLNLWGLGEDEAVLRPVIQNYQAVHPNVTVSYTKQSLLNYRTRLQTQIGVGQGPDIFTIHSSWVQMLLPNLSPAPPFAFSLSDYSQVFYPLAKETLVVDGKIYGVPQDVDGLALFYNEEILKGVGVSVPKDWQEFVEAARRVTVRSQEGQIQTAGAALGTAGNVDYWPEILAMIFLQQPQGDLASPANQAGIEVLQFYTGFVTDPQNKTWDVTLPPSSQMFGEGKLAFYFASARQAQAIKAANTNLPFKVAPVPQLPNRNVTYGGGWVKAVSISSTHPGEAWEFLKYLSSAEVLQQIYQFQTQAGGVGSPYPRVDIAGTLASDPILGAFIIQAPYYQGWYLNSNTQDKGINDEMIDIYGRVVNVVLQGQDPGGALGVAQEEIQQILAKYNIRK